MIVFEGTGKVCDECRGAVVAIGNFDGVHRGHQQLLQVAADVSVRQSVPWGVVTFEPHPREVFRPKEPVFRLTPGPLKCRLFEALGANYTTVLNFDHTLAALNPEQFVESILVKHLHVSHVITGYDFHFGRGRKGSPQTMRELGKVNGFSVSIVDQVTDDDGVAPFSSSGVRAALRHGRVGEAAHQLGYWWTVIGEVVKGDQRGREIGFPTANIVLAPGCEPAEGIYALRVRDLDDKLGQIWHGAGYVGMRPTFNTERLFLEVFLLGFQGDLYGKSLAVEFIDYIRPDRKFDTAEELTRQMALDCQGISHRLEAAEKSSGTMSFLDRAAGVNAL